jgi:hypothetical protein
MQMDHALRVAAGPRTQPDDILSTAGRLLRPEHAPAAPASPRQGQPPNNQATLRACHALLNRTIALLG